MPRKPRTLCSTGIYHIILRSVNQHIIFEEEADYQKFLYILSDCKLKYDIDIYAYCLMDNHIHLLVYSHPNDLSGFFQSLGARFVRWYNSKYSRSGHLFQDRFHSIPIENKPQYLATLSYIHYNPVKANITKSRSEYPWSSFNAFYGQKNPLVNISFSYNVAGSKESLLKYFASHNDAKWSLCFHEKQDEVFHFMTDEKALAAFRKITGLSSTSEVQSLPKAVRNHYIELLSNNGFTQKQIARVMDVSVSTVKKICAR